MIGGEGLFTGERIFLKKTFIRSKSSLQGNVIDVVSCRRRNVYILQPSDNS